MTKNEMAERTDLVFQLLSWNALDCEYGEDDSEFEGTDPGKYLIKLYGITEAGKSVSVNVLDYTPYFFIKIVHRVDRTTANKIREFIVDKLPYPLKNGLLDVSLLRKKDFWGFTNKELCYFARVKFVSLKAYKQAMRIFQRKVQILTISREFVKYKLYESNIEPFLRMMHIRDIEPCGWVKISKEHYTKNQSGVLQTHCAINVECSWTALTKVHIERIAPFKVASFDIECTSSHGDFPVPQKNYKKVAYESLQYFNEHKCDDGIKDTLYDEMIKCFDHEDTTGLFSKVFTKLPVSKPTLETKLKRIIDDVFVILCGKLQYKEEREVKEDAKEKGKDAIMKALTEKLGDFDEKVGWVGIFPPLEGDPIIQIGTTVHQYGDKQCTYKSIITVGTCDPIEGVEVIVCENEKQLLIKWKELIVRLDPDILTGYNIFGFDMSYMYLRAKELGIANDFTKVGRVMDKRCEFVEKMLSSSALGDNILKYIDMDGRVLIDVMKVVQRDHKLDSYKLDNVANHFMKMNKHDVHPSDIFRLQQGSSADRKVIADYCVQDCALCNHLIMKLEILANNIGMANVCNVPLSYIFMRGQGVKIFSLVAKECRADDFLIPTLQNKSFMKPWEKSESDDEEEDEDGYEGAIVLEPKEGIYIDDPVSVLDYASLYPSSMISENLSHDCIILNPKYDNLPGYEYSDVTYDVYEKINDKKVRTGEKTVRFVQFPNGEKGTIPKILMKLLKQRKETRKKIEFQTVKTKAGEEFKGIVKDLDTKIVVTGLDGKGIEVPKEDIECTEDTYDDFQKAVLDGLQLAYKVTANSLYGQCGAKTSQIYMKEIAACTTATGRKMILKAKKFIEDNYADAEVVYGDSVTGDTPLLLKFPDGTVDIVTIETLANKEWIPYEGFKLYDNTLTGKEQTFVDAQVWTNGEWTTIKRVIRHFTKKRLYRVATFRGSVDVTEDHSLVDIEGNEVKPTDCIVGESHLLHSFPENFPETPLQLHGYSCHNQYPGRGIGNDMLTCNTCNTCGQVKTKDEFYYNKRGRCRLCVKVKTAERLGKIVDTSQVNQKVLDYEIGSKEVSKEEAWVWGFFFGDGSCGSYECPSGNKCSWALNNNNKNYLNRARDYLLQNESRDVVFDFKILDTLESSAVYKLVPTGSLKYMVEKYRALFYDKDKYKKVPKIILNASKEVREWFLEGYLFADGSKKAMFTGGLDFACEGKIGAQGLYYIAKSIGWDHLRILIHEYKDNIYWIRYIKTDEYYNESNDLVCKVFDLEDIYGQKTDSCYVYDLETEYGKFHAGVGETIVKNTDSLFLKFRPRDALGNFIKGKDAILPSIKMGQEASKNFRPLLKAPHDLEYEKTFYPFILFSKKRYCANKYEFDDHHYKMTSMGIALKRRDNAPIVKKIYGGVIDIILNEQNIPKSIAFLKESLESLVNGQYPLEELVVTKSLRADYKDPDKIAHKVLAERMAERDPGNKPQVNDRIPFAFIQVPEVKGKKMLQGNRIEHPDYIREKNLQPDYEFYITNQIMKPVLQMYALTLENLEGYRKGPQYFEEMKQKLIKEKEGDMKKVKDRLNDLREEEAKKLLFDPVLIRLENKRKKNTMITDYFRMS